MYVATIRHFEFCQINLSRKTYILIAKNYVHKSVYYISLGHLMQLKGREVIMCKRSECVQLYLPSAGIMRGSVVFLEKVRLTETGTSASLSISRHTSTSPSDSATVLFTPTIWITGTQTHTHGWGFGHKKPKSHNSSQYRT